MLLFITIDFFFTNIISYLYLFIDPKGRTLTGGDVWVLLIKETKPSDTDVYVCEVNSDPVVKSFHPLMGKNQLVI